MKFLMITMFYEVFLFLVKILEVCDNNIYYEQNNKK